MNTYTTDTMKNIRSYYFHDMLLELNRPYLNPRLSRNYMVRTRNPTDDGSTSQPEHFSK